MLSEPGVVLSSPGGLAACCACEDMAENQWLSSKSIGLSLVADMISVCVGGSSFPGLLAWLRVSQRFSDISRAVVQEAWIVVFTVDLLWEMVQSQKIPIYSCFYIV